VQAARGAPFAPREGRTIMADEKSARDRRLAEALRANLRRRKSQSRARDEKADPLQTDTAPCDDPGSDPSESIVTDATRET